MSQAVFSPTPVRAAALACAVGVLVLAGCAGVKPAPPSSGGAPVDPPATSSAPVPAPAPAPSTADQRAAAPSALSAERKWLQSLFAGTPVRIGQTRDGPVTVDVPREFCFDPGQSAIKPPLAAVLDKVSQSLRRLPLARVTLLAAPGDAGAAASPPLAQQRAAELHKHLQARGVTNLRIDKPTTTTAAAVQLELVAVAPR